MVFLILPSVLFGAAEKWKFCANTRTKITRTEWINVHAVRFSNFCIFHFKSLELLAQQ